MGLFDGVAQRPTGIDLVVVAAADPRPLHVAVLHKISDDRLRRPLGDPYPCGDVSAPNAGIARDADQHVTVVGEERPARPRRVLGRAIGASHFLMVAGFAKQRTDSDGRLPPPYDLQEALERCRIHEIRFANYRKDLRETRVGRTRR